MVVQNGLPDGMICIQDEWPFCENLFPLPPSITWIDLQNVFQQWPLCIDCSLATHYAGPWFGPRITLIKNTIKLSVQLNIASSVFIFRFHNSVTAYSLQKDPNFQKCNYLLLNTSNSWCNFLSLATETSERCSGESLREHSPLPVILWECYLQIFQLLDFSWSHGCLIFKGYQKVC